MKATIQNIIKDFGLIQSQKFSYQYEKEIFDGNYFLVKTDDNDDKITVIRVYNRLVHIEYAENIKIDEFKNTYYEAIEIIKLFNSIIENRNYTKEKLRYNITLRHKIIEVLSNKYYNWRHIQFDLS